MPRPKNPNKPEFFVYEFSANGIPFYIGIGRAERASDRIRYVQYMMRREKLGKPVKWSLSTSVIAELIKRDIDIRLRYIKKNISRNKALDVEKQAIKRFCVSGVALTNIQLNPNVPKTLKCILKIIIVT